LKGNMQHPTKKFYSKFIYDLYVKTFEKARWLYNKGGGKIAPSYLDSI
jgi:hypothetical protein